MKIVTVNASRTYDILIGSGLLQALPQQIQKLGKVENILIVSDSTVFSLHADAHIQVLTDSNFSVYSYVFPAGEENKNGYTYLNLMNALAEYKLSRNDLIIALGGGVVGDLAGFAAATYLRGIRYIQIPTTLLAAVDSSVGGKTAIDLPAGKNLAGAFYQPSLVLCDTDLLRTLPEEIFRDGCAEVIKYGILYDPALFSHLEHAGLGFDLENVISRCVELKRDVVTEDEFDTGLRMKLNLGHTIGHAIERCSNFCISHGQAVAIGIAIVSKAAAKTGICSQETCQRIHHILEQFGLPVNTDFTAEALFHFAQSDKKRSGDTVNLIVPKSIGDCSIIPTPTHQLKNFIEAGF